MANYDISASSTSVATSKGPKTYYSFDVIDEKTGQVKASYNTTDPKDAKAWLDSAKSKYGTSKVNGSAGADPFEDSSFTKQSDYEFGGFETEAGVDITSGTPTGPVGSSKYEGRELASRQSSSKLKKVPRDTPRGISEKRLKGKNWKNLSDADKADLGVNGTKRFQAMLKRDVLPTKNPGQDGDLGGCRTESEHVIKGYDNNAFIVLGNDRVEKPHTGYGGKGHTQCDAIDIVAGFGGHAPSESIKQNDVEQYQITNPNFYVDAARIYISQKTDVDKNFGIGEFAKGLADGDEDAKDEKNIGKYGAKSAIAAKADNIRLIGRESIRIVTGTDQINSQGGEILGKSGVEIIANNKIEDLQPMVLGDNLQLALITIIENLEALTKIFQAYTKYQMKFNQALQKHTHVTPFFGLPALPSEVAIIGGIQCDIETAAKTDFSVLKHLTNLAGIKHNFLVDSGESFINSRSNKVN